MDADRTAIAEQNVRAFLHCIRACEGTDSPDGYRALFGYPMADRTFTSFDDHPRVKFPFTQTDGQRNYSSAAGAYQIIVSTYDRLRVKLGVVGFSPGVQDMMALELIAEDSAMADVKAGNVQSAMDKCAGTWASLPASHYAQPKRSVQFALNAYQTAGGMLV